MIERWEYHALRVDTEAAFFATSPHLDHDRLAETTNALGAQGWKLASSFGLDDYRGASRSFALVFKRRSV